MKKLKIFNDPIYGFIAVKSPLIYRIIEHPYFQRLRRISQMGLSYLVYPGAHHTRFHHVLGCTYLMQKAVEILRDKNVEISEREEEALMRTILDRIKLIGDGPQSLYYIDKEVRSINKAAQAAEAAEAGNQG